MALSNNVGTLLDSRSKVLPSSVSAIQAALDQGVLVCLATGKARPAAISALQSVGLAGMPLPWTMLHGVLHWTRAFLSRYTWTVLLDGLHQTQYGL